nr:MAG TPA: Picornaviridae P3A protein [Caudoviricetes sp.]DAV23064.1 MAG TPA: Picornaviridae P3A protein [Caudoviricetes sp.]
MQDKQDKSNFKTSENKNITVLHSQKYTKGDIIKTERGKGNDMEYNTDSKNVYSKNEIDLKLEKINSDIQHGFEKVDLKFDQLRTEMSGGFEKMVFKMEGMFSDFKLEQHKEREENKKWLIGLTVASFLSIVGIIISIIAILRQK